MNNSEKYLENLSNFINILPGKKFAFIEVHIFIIGIYIKNLIKFDKYIKLLKN